MESIQQKGGSVRWYVLGVLVAIELLMSFSFLGYIHVEPISVTFAYIPVPAGRSAAGAAGGHPCGDCVRTGQHVEGLSLLCEDFDQLFSPFLSGRPLESFLLSVGARTLFGLVVGMLYLAGRKSRFSGLWVGIVSYLGQTIHALLVYTALFVLFPETGYRPENALSDLIGVGNITENLIAAAFVLIFWRVTRSKLWKQFQFQLETARKLQAGERYHHLSMVVMVFLTFCSSVSVALYYLHRINYVLNQHGASITDDGYSDLIHLQIQFLIGVLATIVLVAVFVIFKPPICHIYEL